MSFASDIAGARKRQTEAHLRYPSFVSLLKQAGVASYTVNVATFATTYTGRKGESHVVPGASARTVAGSYNNSAIDTAVHASQRGEIEEVAFYDRLAAAGVASVEARLADNVVIYEGHGSTYAEAVGS